MRNAFADEILQAARADARVVLLSGDIGNRLFDKFKVEFPGRFYNCGVAEANMISMAAGLAACGLRPVCYTITPFVTTRCLEQIKVDVGYHAMPVLIVGTGSGLSYASLGATHHSFEDIAILRTIPGMRVLAPADAPQLRAILLQELAGSQPAYLRIGKKGEPILTEGLPHSEGWSRMREGSALTLLSTGTILSEVLRAADALLEDNIAASVWNCACIKPLDKQTLLDLPAGPVLTVEEHSVVGGFGSAVAGFLAQCRPGIRVLPLGIPDAFLHDCGEQDEARAHCGIDARGIRAAAWRILGRE